MATSASSNTAADAVANQTFLQTPSVQNTGTASTQSRPDNAVTIEQIGNLQNSPIDTSSPVSLLYPPTRGPNSDDKSNTAPATTSISTTGKAAPVPHPNPLFAYPSYTYGLSLHLLSKDDYNGIRLDASHIKPSKTLISSALRYPTVAAGRHPEFLDDFYFDSLKMETIIGLNAHSKATNAITIDFTIIEPYGMTLLDRILKMQSSDFGAKNHTSMPYLLELNFFGNADDGSMSKIPNQDKWFPIQITGFKIKASGQGSVYTISAIPYNHVGMLQSIQSTPANFEITGTTVYDFLQGTEDGVLVTSTPNSSVSDTARVEKKQSTTPSNNVRTTSTVQSKNSQSPALSQVTSTGSSSYANAYNSWEKAAVSRGAMVYPDSISFSFDDKFSIDGIPAGAISRAKVVDPNKNPYEKTDMTANFATTAHGNNASAQSLAGAGLLKSGTQNISIKAGDSIAVTVNQLIVNSEYIRNQILDPEARAAIVKDPIMDPSNLFSLNKNKPLNWFKLAPEIILVEFDVKRNDWARHVIYHIIPYRVYNDKDPHANVSAPPGAVKNYNYLYTGENRDVIDFDIDFDNLYFNSAQIQRDKMETIVKIKANPDPESKDNSPRYAPGSIASPKLMIESGNAPSAGMGTVYNAENQLAAQVASNLYSSLRGDMLNVKLRIVGDPDFIKQDDLIYTPSNLSVSAADQYLKGNSGSLNMNSGEIFCTLKFKTPADIDETTGLLRKSGYYIESKFSGYYRILRVESEFRQGKFTQVLDLIRQLNQPDDSDAKTIAPDPQKEDSNYQDDTVQRASRRASRNVSTEPIAAPTTPAQKVKITAEEQSVSSPRIAIPVISFDPTQPPQVFNADGLAQVLNGPTVSITQGQVDGSPIIGPLTSFSSTIARSG